MAVLSVESAYTNLSARTNADPKRTDLGSQFPSKKLKPS